jgi:hypothetical protein
MKQKYERPIVRDMNALPISSGSCVSGRGEATVTERCATAGALALGACGGGGQPKPEIVCLPSGNLAGYSCVNGNSAG